MMRPVDLTPAPARQRAARRANRRKWVVAYICIIALSGTVTAAARFRTSSLERELLDAKSGVARATEKLAAVSEISAELVRIADSMELQQKVTPRPSVAEILRTIRSAAPQSMTLTSLLLDQRQNATTASIRLARKNNEESDVKVSTTVEIAGVTPEDAEVVRLIQALDRTGRFQGTSLEYSRPITVRGVEARAFRIVSSAPAVALPEPPPEKEATP